MLIKKFRFTMVISAQIDLALAYYFHTHARQNMFSKA